jgi:hypothetical protein
MKSQQEDPVLIEIISDRAAKVFESRYPNLLVCFSVGDVFSALASYFRVEGLPQDSEFNVPNLVKATESGFLELLRRGAFDPFVKVTPLPEAAQVELDRMAGISPKAVDPRAESRASQAFAFDECISDFRGRLDSRAFRNKWLAGDPARRAIYENVIAAGRI